MLQLAAIAAANPSLVGPGGRATFLVVGARGDADVWTFVHVADEALAEGSAPALRLLREPSRAYDTHAEVRLDPARHYLPVRAPTCRTPRAATRSSSICAKRCRRGDPRGDPRLPVRCRAGCGPMRRPCHREP